MAYELVVLDGPVEASGYDWYLVQPRVTPANRRRAVVPVRLGRCGRKGRRAVDRAGTTTYARRSRPTLESPCLGEPSDFESLVEIACFGGEDISFQAPTRRATPAKFTVRHRVPVGHRPGWLDLVHELERAHACFGQFDGPDRARSSWPIWAPGVDTSLVRDYDTPREENGRSIDHRDVRPSRDAKLAAAEMNYEEPSSPKPPSPDWVDAPVSAPT